MGRSRCSTVQTRGRFYHHLHNNPKFQLIELKKKQNKNTVTFDNENEFYFLCNGALRRWIWWYPVQSWRQQRLQFGSWPIPEVGDRKRIMRPKYWRAQSAPSKKKRKILAILLGVSLKPNQVEIISWNWGQLGGVLNELTSYWIKWLITISNKWLAKSSMHDLPWIGARAKHHRLLRDWW